MVGNRFDGKLLAHTVNFGDNMDGNVLTGNFLTRILQVHIMYGHRNALA